MKHVFIFLTICLIISCNQKESKIITLCNDTVCFKLSEKFKGEADTSIQFLWQEKVWDQEIKDTVEKIHINNTYAQTASVEAKLVLAYISLYAGSECWWKGEEPNNDMTNLQCVILSSLNLGCQCSKEHLIPLRKAFAKDSIALQKIEECAAVPYTATYQNTFTNIIIQKKSNQYFVKFKATMINNRKKTVKPWESLIIFDVNEKGINVNKQIMYSNY